MPIIGNGDIASVLEDNYKIIYFASGVSNSGCKDEREYDRERGMLHRYLKIAKDNRLKLVYFSSLQVLNSCDNRYFEHKLEMEDIVEFTPNYSIIRIGNITWGKNPHTLINHLKAHPEAEIQDVYRHILTKEAFLYWVARFHNLKEANITGETLKVSEIVKRIKERNL